MIPGITASRLKRSATPGLDPYWENVRSLLHFDGANGSQVFKDEKGKVWSSYGEPVIDTSQSKFGGASVRLQATYDYLRTPYVSGHFDPRVDLTVEAWVRLASSKRHNLCCFHNSGRGHFYSILADGKIRVGYETDTGTNIIDTASTIPLSTWKHLAVTKSGQTIRVFVDGVIQVTKDIDGTPTVSTNNPFIGVEQVDVSRYFDGWIDDFRYTEGVARYTANFTPPAAAFPNS